MAAPRPIEGCSSTRVIVDGRGLVSFAGCDTLGLARHPDVIRAATDALARCGLSASASRTTTGTFAEHVALERSLAAWFEQEDAVVLPAGWLAGQAVVQALAGGSRAILADAVLHPALEDALRLADLPTERFAHFDAAAAARAGERLIGMRPLIVTDALDLTAGRRAPLRELAAVAVQLDGTLVIDDAHGVGVLGARGRGTAEDCGVLGPDLFVAGTLSKALGAHGGFVTGTSAFCDDIRGRVRAYAGATPIPPAVAAGARAAVELARNGAALRSRLAEHTTRVADALTRLGQRIPEAGLPWFAIDGLPATALAGLSASLERSGLLVPHLRYFGTGPDGILKIALSAAHTESDITHLLDTLATALPATLRPERGEGGDARN